MAFWLTHILNNMSFTSTLPAKFQKRCQIKGYNMAWLDGTWKTHRNISLPDLFPKLNNIDTIQELWDGFHNLYEVLKNSNEAKKFVDDAKQWVEILLTFTSQKCHSLCSYFLSTCSRISKNINQFTQQGMKKFHDQATLDFAKSTNHNYHNLDALKQLMQKHNRLEDFGYECTHLRK